MTRQINQFLLCVLLALPAMVQSQCPWQQDFSELHSSCLCAYNLGSELSVQCDQVDFLTLIDALEKYAKSTPLDLLYVNNSTVKKLENNIFQNLQLHNVQLSSCKIKTIEDGAFKGQERFLKNLNLQDNLLLEVPTRALTSMKKMNLLDLSKNKISTIPNDSFKGLGELVTLKLMDNNLTLSRYSFRGLENSLKNLNLKGTKQKRVPDSIRGMRKLAFLDLSLNGIRELPGSSGSRTFEDLDSLTALNLERNLISTLGESAFQGARKTLSSLSLLNNLLSEFPVGSIHSLKQLKVLDIGFNLITAIPEIAFRGNPFVTLLAFDGNPITTVSERTLSHLNKTLRGLSLGGRFLNCDCNLKWIAEWVRTGELQVTSRERNPQFCGSPVHFRERGFYSIQPEEFKCDDRNSSASQKSEVIVPKPFSTPVTPSSTTLFVTPSSSVVSSPVTRASHKGRQTSRTTSTTTTTAAPQPSSTSTTTQKVSLGKFDVVSSQADVFVNNNNNNHPSTTSRTTTSTAASPAKTTTKTSGTWRQQQQQQPSQKQRYPLVLGPPQKGAQAVDESKEIMLKNAFRQDNSVIIQWESDTTNILGFRVVYRLFGDKSFKQGPPLESTEREFKIKNVPVQECIIVCVISLEELIITPENVPYAQCREVRTVAMQTSNMDKITIVASASICGTIIIAVIIFIAASRRRSKKIRDMHSTLKNPLPIAGLPVNCCVSTPSPNGPLGSLATLQVYNAHKDWDQVSIYSGRSIPRPRMYQMDNSGHIPDDLRSHISQFSSIGPMGRMQNEGKSMQSMQNLSPNRAFNNAGFSTNIVNSRPDLRQSRTSLAAQERMSRPSYAGSISFQNGPTSIASSSRRTRSRSHSRDHLNMTTAVHPSNRPGSRFSQSGSMHNLNNCYETSDNWTDNDMEIYMTRNATARSRLVPL